MTPANFQQFSNVIWSVADLLRGPYRPPQYERVMLSLTVLRRFDCVLAPTKRKVLAEYEKHKHKDSQLVDRVLNSRAKDEAGSPLGFHNHSSLDFQALKGDPDNIGRHLTDYINGFSENVRKIFESFEFDKHPENRFDYLLANPPFGVDWNAEQKVINRWPNFRGYSGKLPRVNDGALLFLIHMISKFQPFKEGNRDKPGTRVAIVFNGSPLFTGGAGSGESEIRRWIIEHDWLEAIIALPEQMFYNEMAA